VTGGGRGIGAAVASRPASEGAAVVIGYRHAVEAADELTARLKDQGARAMAVRADVAVPERMGELVDRGVDAFGRLDILEPERNGTERIRPGASAVAVSSSIRSAACSNSPRT
jgi:NAD(P)-dependent dehydrogenase (short-subunit alcohol dehydrogenase family)